MKKRLVTGILAFASLIATPLSFADVEFDEARIRQPPPGAMATAGYVTIRNSDATDVKLLSATSERFGMIEFHLTELKDGVYRMIPHESFVIPASGELVLKPESYHLMLMQPQGKLEIGDRVEIVFRIGDREIPILFTVIAH